MTKSVSSTLTEKWEMKALMDEHLHSVENTEYFHYDRGWNDAKVSKAVNPAFNSGHARFVRMEMFGKLKGWSKSGQKKLRLTERVELLEKQVAILMASTPSLEKKG